MSIIPKQRQSEQGGRGAVYLVTELNGVSASPAAIYNTKWRRVNGGALTVTATVAPQMTEVTAYAIIYHIRYVAQLQSCSKRNWGATCSLIDKAAGSGSTLHSTFIDLHMDVCVCVCVCALHTYSKVLHVLHCEG